MKNFDTALFYEKFIIREKDSSGKEGKIVCEQNNRVAFVLGEGNSKEMVTVRSNRAYIAMITASRILRDYFQEDEDPILERIIPVEWDKIWNSTLSDYEKKYNIDVWVSIYVNGKKMFVYQQPELIEVVEKCTNVVGGDYQNIADILKSMVGKVEQDKDVEHLSELYSSINFKEGLVNCKVMRCVKEDASSCDIKISGGENDNSLIEESLLVCAAFLELFDLQSFVSHAQSLVDRDEIDDKHEDINKMRNALARIEKVNGFITETEKEYKIEYSPAKPD